MRPRVGIALAAGSIAAGTVASAVLGYRHGEALVAQRLSEFGPRFEAWRTGFQEERRKVAHASAASVAWRRGAMRRLSDMQAGIVLLEARAEGLKARAEEGGAEQSARAFDFEAEPGVGGPAELAETDLGPFLDWDVAAMTLEHRLSHRIEQVEILGELLKRRDLREAIEPEGRPVSAAYVSSAFGTRIDPFTGRKATHKGIDFAGRPGTEIVAVAAGIVTFAGERSGYGRTVEIDHGHRRITRYAHNLENLVSVGDVVTRGQTIARLGSSGRTTGPNLHFEVLVDGVQVDPMNFVE